MHKVANWTLNEKTRRFRDRDLGSDGRSVPSLERSTLYFFSRETNSIAFYYLVYYNFFINESLDKLFVYVLSYNYNLFGEDPTLGEKNWDWKLRLKKISWILENFVKTLNGSVRKIVNVDKNTKKDRIRLRSRFDATVLKEERRTR